MYITGKHNKPYRPGHDRWSIYKNLWRKHWKGFQAVYDSRYRQRYGPLTPNKIAEVEKLLACGNYQNGFRKHECPDCGTHFIVPFTCKSRLCLSCLRKKLYGWSINLSTIMDTSFNHLHVTFTMPGGVSARLARKGFDPEVLMRRAADTYWQALRKDAKNLGPEWSCGTMATLHPCGNSLNYNPHVHLIGTRELVNRYTGEITACRYFDYRSLRFRWRDDLLAMLQKQGYFTKIEIQQFKERYDDGFHVHVQPIAGNNNAVLFRTSEYMAFGFFHNSQIVAVEEAKHTITFRYKSWVNQYSGKKTYSTTTMDIYEFMARMLYYLPDRHRKMIRYYGIYANGAGKKLKEIHRRTWAAAIANSFKQDPEKCPDCGSTMQCSIVYSSRAEAELQAIWKTHWLVGGYFRLNRGP